MSNIGYPRTIGQPIEVDDHLKCKTFEVVDTMDSGMYQVVSESFTGALAAENTDHDDADQTIPGSAEVIAALAAANNVTAMTIAAQPDVPRNICISHKNASGGAGVDQVACSYAVVGTFRGVAQTETISFASVTTVANGTFRYVYGSKPFTTITSITPSIAQNASMQRCAGLGTKLGLANPTLTTTEASIVKITKNLTPVAVTGTYSTNETVNPGNITAGQELSIKYKTAGLSIQV